MTLNQKYIVVSYDGKEEPIIFPTSLNHDCMYDNEKIVSAGFCDITIIKERSEYNVVCSGKSESLNIVARPDVDAKIITKFLENNYDFTIQTQLPIIDRGDLHESNNDKN